MDRRSFARPVAILFALLCGALFFWSAPRLWPLAPVDLTKTPPQRVSVARAALDRLGIDHKGAVGTGLLTNNTVLIDYLDRKFGRDETARLLRSGLPAITYDTRFVRSGDPHTLAVSVLPDGRLALFLRSIEDDDTIAAEPVPTESDARRAIGKQLEVDVTDWRLVTRAERTQPNRVDRTFTWERTLSDKPELRERASVTFAGAELSTLIRQVPIPPSERRELRKRAAAPQTLFLIGQLALALAVAAAFIVFTRRLSRGVARVGRAAGIVGVATLCFLIEYALRPREIDPLVPPALTLAQALVNALSANLWTFALLVAVVAAGDAVDQDLVADGQKSRAASLWSLMRGKLTDPQVAAASARGVLIGLVCGGVMAATVLLLTITVGARCALQPRDFAVTMRNDALPPVATLCYFLFVALNEELGYRFFAGPYLLKRFKNLPLAIFLPALVYGLTHTTLGFLPPDEPFWGRALVMTLVGCVWGWAYFRYDALTVILSHVAADVFIFNWPALAGEDPSQRATAASAILVPLLPAILYAIRFLFRATRRGHTRRD